MNTSDLAEYDPDHGHTVWICGGKINELIASETFFKVYSIAATRGNCILQAVL